MKSFPYKAVLGVAVTAAESSLGLAHERRAQADEAKARKMSIAKERPAAAQETYAMAMVVQDLYQVLSDEQIDEGGGYQLLVGRE